MPDVSDSPVTAGGRGPIRVLELRSVRGTGGGPEKTILLGAARSVSSRYAVTVCYVRDRRDDVFAIHERGAALGVDYVDVFEKNSFDPGIWPQLRRLVREKRIDIVHAHDYKTDLLALALGKAEGIIPLSTAHGWTGHAFRESLYYYFDKKLLARFPHVIAVSSEIRDELVRTGTRAERVTVVLNGIDHEKFFRDPARVTEARAACGVPDGRTVIGAIGRLEPQKRFDLLMQAFARLRQKRPDLLLLIAGEGSVRPQLEAEAARLALGESCRLLGHCGDVSVVHHAMDLFVQSSQYEGTPNAVLEAMAFESPIVATAAGGTAELVLDGVHGLIIPTHDVEALVSATERVLADPAASAARAQAARKRVEGDLSFATRMQRVERIYDQLGRQKSAI
jgi:glycosyltransferase involved in cell wall biosynthesis